jgi:hypothetical protein
MRNREQLVYLWSNQEAWWALRNVVKPLAIQARTWYASVAGLALEVYFRVEILQTAQFDIAGSR